MTLKIGDLELKNPFLLAPLAGITDKAMRSLCAEAGASLTYTEMVSAKGLWYGDRKTKSLLDIGEAEGPVAFQIFGSEPEIMEHAAKSLCMGIETKSGMSVPALLDLNAGCPVPKIVRNGEGSALLRDLQKLHDTAKAIVKGAAGRRPVTAKMRIGFTRGGNVAVEAAKALEAAGVSAITVHGRTREQYYEGKADWQSIAEVKKAVSVPVIGNGDVFTGGDAVRMMDETGCDGVMIARGAMGNPWIFREALSIWEGRNDFMPPQRDERIEMLIRHLDLVIEDKGERIAVKEMRKHIAWYTKGMHGATAVRREVNNVDDAAEMKRIIGKLLGE